MRNDKTQGDDRRFSIFWTILEDCRAAKLEGFGRVSEALAPRLDPKIGSLVSIVNAIKSAATE